MLLFNTILTYITGFPFSYGVFQAYYSSLDLFKDDRSGIAVIGVCGF